MSRDSGFDWETDYLPDNLTTPSNRIHSKKLSIAPGSSSKRSLFRDEIILSKKNINSDYPTSDVESDLGPMSPLALTDQSSCDSSPGNHFVSPFASPENSPSKWDRLRLGCRNQSPSVSPFRALRKITKAARSSPRKNLFIGMDIL